MEICNGREFNLERGDKLRLKYKVEEGGWFTKTPRGCAGSSPWKNISKESRQVQQFYVCVRGWQ